MSAEWQRQDKRMRARVDGREDKARRTVWQLTIGSLAIRCLATGERAFQVEARSSEGWAPLPAMHGPDASKLFATVATAPRILEHIATRATEINQ